MTVIFHKAMAEGLLISLPGIRLGPLYLCPHLPSTKLRTGFVASSNQPTEDGKYLGGNVTLLLTCTLQVDAGWLHLY